ncbi:MAG: hypothetical protein J6S09_04785 [Paludibacteraceae bacterium]|nr:hypothetical protein [Paludibacteraceae bacterium]
MAVYLRLILGLSSAAGFPSRNFAYHSVTISHIMALACHGVICPAVVSSYHYFKERTRAYARY